MAKPLPSSAATAGNTDTAADQDYVRSGGAAPGSVAANVSEIGGGVSAGPAEQNATSDAPAAVAGDAMDGGPAPGSLTE